MDKQDFSTHPRCESCENSQPEREPGKWFCDYLSCRMDSNDYCFAHTDLQDSAPAENTPASAGKEEKHNG